MTDTIADVSKVSGGGLNARALLPWLCSAALLVGILGDRLLLRRKSADAEAYHQLVRQAARDVPYHFGDWLGVDVPVSEGAMRLLKPNVMISRRYDQIGTGRRVTLLLVQCKDARDLLGHFPPVCYRGQGWNLASARPRDWQVGDQPVCGMCYDFRMARQGVAGAITVDNFMFLPTGSTARDMDAVDEAARDASRKFLGAAQVQLVYDSPLSDAQRTDVFEQFVQMLRPLLQAMTEQQKKVAP